MKHHIKHFILTSLVALTIPSCTGNFEEMNTSPNNSADPNTALLLTGAIRAIGSQTQGIAGWAKDLYPQYTAEIQYTSESRFQNIIYNYYPIYNGPLQDLQTIINLNDNPETNEAPYVLLGGSTANQIAVSRILKAFYFMHITDRWGMAPYSEALQGIAVLSPRFDSQEAIYDGIFSELTEAAMQLDDAGDINGDILYNGDITKWRKWANTLRMIAAIHIRKVSPVRAQQEFSAALQAGVFNSNADNAVFYYLEDANNQSPLYNNYLVGQRYDYMASETIVEKLQELSDPRLPVYAEPTISSGEYIGMPYGLPQAATGDYNRENVSLVGERFQAQGAELPISTYAQVEFMLAEAASLAWIDGAEQHYYAGIEASLSHLGLSSAYSSYVAQPQVAFAGGNALEKIITQKWIANYLGNGYESWTDWRRTGYPMLDPGPAPLNTNGELPRRQAYTTEEAGRNSANYQAAISQQGPDALTTRIWWDVE